jgi:hypothetical protein
MGFKGELILSTEFPWRPVVNDVILCTHGSRGQMNTGAALMGSWDCVSINAAVTACPLPAPSTEGYLHLMVPLPERVGS